MLSQIDNNNYYCISYVYLYIYVILTETKDIWF